MKNHFDVLVIGGGSGGLAHAQRASEYGASSAVVESGPLGGTCVNVGCVPKKVMWYGAHIAHSIHDAAGYGIDASISNIDWGVLKDRRDAYVRRLNDIHERLLRDNGVDYFNGHGRFVDAHTLRVGDETVTARHIVIATGGRPRIPDIPGAGLGIDSDGFFALEDCPATVAVVGSGYIGVELAGMFAALGAKVRQFVRYDAALRTFDPMIQDALKNALADAGVELVTKSVPESIRGEPGNLRLHTADGQSHGPFEQVLWAVGRDPSTDRIDIANAGVDLDDRGHV
ncbi:MAG: FAD-dependent oxidoreductase, partial [Gammaproteobacteria bacterium]|nr:FAD-dependent oxidoreductase [Gammaproteobacteria bacterium]